MDGNITFEGQRRDATAIDNVPIGQETPAVGAFTTLSGTAAVITGGTVDGTPIGGTTPAAAAVTTLSASGATTFESTITAIHINAVSHEDQVICHEDEIIFV